MGIPQLESKLNFESSQLGRNLSESSNKSWDLQVLYQQQVGGEVSEGPDQQGKGGSSIPSLKKKGKRKGIPGTSFFPLKMRIPFWEGVTPLLGHSSPTSLRLPQTEKFEIPN